MSKEAVKAGIYLLFALVPVYLWNRYTGASNERKMFEGRKSFYRQRRDAFQSDEQAVVELEQWKARKCDCDYVKLTGMIPAKLVGKTNENNITYEKCDTWFSEFASHNDPSLILSESADSYVIGNLASYDQRQYPQWFNPNNKPGINTPEGQGFGHCLVIPKRRIYNIVDPEATANDAAVIKELRHHFRAFWRQGGSRRILQRTRFSFDEQNAKLAAKVSMLESYNKLLPVVEADFRTLSHIFSEIKVDDFEYAFHAFPDASVGHLHMHVFPKKGELRKFSTRQHDWKTIPIEAVLEVEQEDQRTKGNAAKRL